MSQNRPSLLEVTLEPDLATLNEQFEAYAENGELMGKFVRIGNLVLTAPYTPLTREPGISVGKLYHANMMDVAFELGDTELTRKFRAEREACSGAAGITEYAPHLKDAGWFAFKQSPSQLILLEESDAFGRADEAGRELTAQLIQDRLGDGIDVISDDDYLAEAA